MGVDLQLNIALQDLQSECPSSLVNRSMHYQGSNRKLHSHMAFLTDQKKLDQNVKKYAQHHIQGQNIWVRERSKVSV